MQPAATQRATSRRHPHQPGGMIEVTPIGAVYTVAVVPVVHTFCNTDVLVLNTFNGNNAIIFPFSLRLQLPI